MPTRSICAWRKSIRPTPAAISSGSAALFGSTPKCPTEEAFVTAASRDEDLAPFAVCSPIASNLHRIMLGLQASGREILAANPGKVCASRTGSESRSRLHFARPGTAAGAAIPRRCSRSNSASHWAAPKSRAATSRPAAMRLHGRGRLCIPFGENMTIEIFSFSFRIQLSLTPSFPRAYHPDRSARDRWEDENDTFATC